MVVCTINRVFGIVEAMAAKTLRDILNEDVPLDVFKEHNKQITRSQDINSIIINSSRTGSRTVDTGKSQQMFIQNQKTLKIKQFYADHPATSNDLKLLFDQGFDNHNLKECINALLNSRYKVTYYDLKFILENATQLDAEDLKDIINTICLNMTYLLDLGESPTVMDLALKLKDPHPELISILKTYKFKSTAEWVLEYVQKQQWIFLKTKTDSYDLNDWLQIVKGPNNTRMTAFYVLITQNNMSKILTYIVFPLCELEDAKKCILPDNTPLEDNQVTEVTQLLNNICMEYYMTNRDKWLQISELLFRIHKSLKRAHQPANQDQTEYIKLIEQNKLILKAVIETAMRIHDIIRTNNHDDFELR